MSNQSANNAPAGASSDESQRLSTDLPHQNGSSGSTEGGQVSRSTTSQSTPPRLAPRMSSPSSSSAPAPAAFKMFPSITKSSFATLTEDEKAEVTTAFMEKFVAFHEKYAAESAVVKGKFSEAMKERVETPEQKAKAPILMISDEEAEQLRAKLGTKATVKVTYKGDGFATTFKLEGGKLKAKDRRWPGVWREVYDQTEVKNLQKVSPIEVTSPKGVLLWSYSPDCCSPGVYDLWADIVTKNPDECPSLVLAKILVLSLAFYLARTRGVEVMVSDGGKFGIAFQEADQELVRDVITMLSAAR